MRQGLYLPPPAQKWTAATREGLADEFGTLVRQALFAEDDEDIHPFERAVRLLADALLEEINQEQPRPGFLRRVNDLPGVDAWLLTDREGTELTSLCTLKNLLAKMELDGAALPVAGSQLRRRHREQEG